jgi:stage V sporulation protein B
MYTLSSLSPRKKAFLLSTLLLTASGFICRVLGFFYRIFLSRTIGAEGLGIYHMIHPVFGICFSLCAGSMQTALSQLIASRTADGKRIFHRGILLSMGMSLVLAALICRYSVFLADCVLMAPECAPYLPIMGLSVPFAAFHACINGYYYGFQKSRVPAFSQIAEQVIRMTLVFFLAGSMIAAGKEITVELAVTGHLIGEMASALFTFLCLLFIPPQRASASSRTPAASITLPLLTLALPLMGNRLVLNILASAEAVWIPNRLQRFGLSSAEAFSVYGVLTGMALPFILFPSAITNSMAVLLLPNVAQAQSEGKPERIASCIAMSLRYSLYMGILCTGIFILFGSALGTSVFHDPTAGRFIRILAWLCPFLYLSTTTGSILNGLGRTRTTFLQNTAALVLRIGFVLFGIPRFGIMAYLWGMLASELFLSLLHLYALFRQIPFFWNAWEMIGKPAFFLLLSVGIHYFVSALHPETGQLPLFLETALQIFFFSFSYGGLLLVFHLGRLGSRR